MNKFILSILLFTFFFVSKTAKPDNCDTEASKVGTCAVCSDGFILYADGFCYKKITNCVEIDTVPGNCKTCSQLYTLSLTKKSCQLPILNCDPLGHDDIGNCLKCSSGFSPTTDGKLCVKTITGCFKFNELGNCIEVKGCSGYETDPSDGCKTCIGTPKIVPSNTKKTCQPAIENCEQISDTGLCLKCKVNFQISESKKACKAMLTDSCSSINDDGICTKCLDPIKVPMAAKKEDCPAAGCTSKCFPKIDNCLAYNDDKTCLACIAGMEPKESKCVKSIPQCKTLDKDGFCTECIEGFAIADTKLVCIRKIPNCNDAAGKVSAAGKCLGCAENFQLNAALGTCIPKDDNCVTFGTAGCTLCKDGFVLNGLNCVKSIPNCLEVDGAACKAEKCAPGFVGVDSNKKCVPVIKDCAEYENTGICKKCKVLDPDTLKLTGSGRVCVTGITNCALYDDMTGKCLGCAKDKGIPVNMGSDCAKEIVDCIAYEKAAEITKCLACSAGKTLTVADGKTTCTTPDSLTQKSFALSFYGDGQLVFYSGTTRVCLAHDIVPTLVDTKQIVDLSTASPAIKFVDCSSEVVEKTLWNIVILAADSGKDADSNKDADKMIETAGGSKKVAITPKFLVKDVSIKKDGKAYSAINLRLYSNAADSLILGFVGFTAFDLTHLANKLGEDVFEPGFTLKFNKNYAVALPDNVADPGTVSPGTDFNTGKFLTYGGTSTPKWDATAQSTNYFDFLRVFATNLEYEKDKNANLKDLVDQKITISDDLVSIEWTPKTITSMTGIFPVLQGPKNPPTTLISSVCNSRYPDSSSIPFQFLYETADHVNGKPDPTKLSKIAVANFPIWKLVDCGFTYTTDAKSLESKLSGKIGFFRVSDATNDGYFRNVVFEMNSQTASRDVRIENVNLFELFKQDVDLNHKIIFNSQIRFFKDATLKQEILGPFEDEPRGLLVNGTNVVCELRLVSGNKDPNADSPINTDPNVEARLPLVENYKITKVQAFVYKKTKIDSADAILTYELPLVGSLVNTKPNSAVVTLDLNKISPGKYSLVFKYTLLNNRQPGGKRILAEINNKKSSILDEKNLIGGISSGVEFQYGPPIEGLDMKKLIFEIGLILCSLMLFLA